MNVGVRTYTCMCVYVCVRVRACVCVLLAICRALRAFDTRLMPRHATVAIEFRFVYDVAATD